MTGSIRIQWRKVVFLFALALFTTLFATGGLTPLQAQPNSKTGAILLRKLSIPDIAFSAMLPAVWPPQSKKYLPNMDCRTVISSAKKVPAPLSAGLPMVKARFTQKMSAITRFSGRGRQSAGILAAKARA